MKDGIGNFLWKISVALYLIANGVLGLSKGGDFQIIFGSILKGDVGIFVIIAGVISLVAGVCIILEMLNMKVSFLDTLIFIIAIIWAVFVILGLISWITNTGSVNFWHFLQRLAVHLMVLASLLIASRKFG